MANPTDLTKTRGAVVRRWTLVLLDDGDTGSGRRGVGAGLRPTLLPVAEPGLTAGGRRARPSAWLDATRSGPSTGVNDPRGRCST